MNHRSWRFATVLTFILSLTIASAAVAAPTQRVASHATNASLTGCNPNGTQDTTTNRFNYWNAYPGAGSGSYMLGVVANMRSMHPYVPIGGDTSSVWIMLVGPLQSQYVQIGIIERPGIPNRGDFFYENGWQGVSGRIYYTYQDGIHNFQIASHNQGGGNILYEYYIDQSLVRSETLNWLATSIQIAAETHSAADQSYGDLTTHMWLTNLEWESGSGTWYSYTSGTNLTRGQTGPNATNMFASSTSTYNGWPSLDLWDKRCAS